MSKVNNLIKKFCSNGVRFYRIKDIAKVTIGEFVHKNRQSDDSPYPVYNGGTSNTGFYDEYNNDGNKVIISARGANAGFVNRVQGKYWAGNSCYTININDESIITCNYLYQYLKNNQSALLGVQQNGGIPAISKKQVEEFKIALPPIEVQEEIVRILQKFDNLEVELKAELEERKKQYEFWRETLCGGTLEELKDKEQKEIIKIYKMSEVGTLTRGKRFVKADSVETGAACIHYGELYTYYGISAYKTKSYIRQELANKLRFAEKGDVVIVGAGENDVDIGVGVAWLGDESPAIHDACYIFKHSLNPKYIAYYLRTNLYHNQLKSWVSEGKICAVSAKGIGECIIPIPSLEKQKEIVKILDKFDKLINDTSEGLPAEIELRKKQYEYYRNKLLNFEEMIVNE